MAGTFLRERLPKEIADSLSSAAPELVDGSFIDGEFRQHLTDRLFRVETVTGRAVYVYVLVEHKSHPDDWIAFQLLRYLVRIWEQAKLKLDRGDRLPPVVPLVIYHGREAWRIPPLFSALVNAEESWREHLLDFRFPVVDLGRIDDAALSRDDRLRGGFLTLKYVFQRGVTHEVVAGIGRALREDPELAKRTLLYLIQAYEELDMDRIHVFSEEAFPGKAEEYKSIFAREMISKGRHEEASSLFRRLLQKKFAAGDLPVRIEEKLAGATLEEIESWTDRILDARTLEDIFDNE